MFGCDFFRSLSEVVQALIAWSLIEYFKTILKLLGDPEVIANIYCKSRNLPSTDM